MLDIEAEAFDADEDQDIGRANDHRLHDDIDARQQREEPHQPVALPCCQRPHMIALGTLHPGEADETCESQALDQERRHALVGLHDLSAGDFRFAHLGLQKQKGDAEDTDRRQRHRDRQHEQADRVDHDNHENAGEHDLPEHVVGGTL